MSARARQLIALACAVLLLAGFVVLNRHDGHTSLKTAGRENNSQSDDNGTNGDDSTSTTKTDGVVVTTTSLPHSVTSVTPTSTRIQPNGSPPSAGPGVTQPPPPPVKPDEAITQFSLPTSPASPYRIAAGAHNDLWFTEAEGHKVGRITVNGAITEFPVPSTNENPANPAALAIGPDGAIWFTDTNRPVIGRMTTDGNLTTYPVGIWFNDRDIRVGPDNALWFTSCCSTAEKGYVARLTTAGQLTKYETPTNFPWYFDVGSDKNFWVGEDSAITRVTPQGQMTRFQLPSEWDGYNYILSVVAGPDGAIWFATRNQTGATAIVADQHQRHDPTIRTRHRRVTDGHGVR